MSDKEELPDKAIKQITFSVEYTDGERKEATFTISEFISVMGGPFMTMVPMYLVFIYSVAKHLKRKL